MPTLDAAVDDYLHLIVRTRPWTKAREEALLLGLVEWLYAQPDQDIQLAAATPALAERYATAQQLDPAARSALFETLTKLWSWATGQGLVAANPYDALSTA